VSGSDEDDRQRHLEQENAELRERIGNLVQEVIDLRASALLWRELYEEAIGRLRDYEERGT
jgi:hypothetical protein